MLQSQGIEPINGERADTALCTTGAAGKPSPTTPGGIRQRRVNNLDELPVSRTEVMSHHHHDSGMLLRIISAFFSSVVVIF
jgi:hypothetical protein